MRKRIIIVNGVLVFLSIMFLYLFNMLLINTDSKNSSYKQIEDYSELVIAYFNGDNVEETINYFSKLEELRVSIYDSNLNFIKDSKYDNDLNDVRPELNDLGVIYTRESTNLGIEMLYLASADDGYIIRVSVEVSSINSFIVLYSQIGSLILFAILSFSVISSLYLLKKTMTPINNVVSKLGSICNNDHLSIENEDELHLQIDSIQTQIQNKIVDLETEKMKIETILEASAEGILVVDDNKNISIINNKALEILSVSSNVLNSAYLNLVNSKELVEILDNLFSNKKVSKKEIFINNNVYTIKIVKLNNDLIKGILITLTDVTTEYNLSKVKKDFFQNASHELKSPLTSIIGYQQLIEQGIYESEEEMIDNVKSTIKQANRMNNLIIDMLELSQLESEYEEDTSNINVKLIILDVLDSLTLFINKRNIKIVLNVEDCVLNINKNHIEQLIKNLIENGIKYNNENSNLEITLKKDSFTIKDYGIGIDCKNIDRIFERFYRVSSNNQIRGNGLGLAIVKHITNIYNFEITVDSVLTQYTEIKITF